MVDDSSSDSTFEISRRMLKGSGIVTRIGDGVVGKARSMAAQIAIGRHSGHTSRHWLANTDADCWVPETWLVDQLSIADTNVEAIAGIVDVDNFGEHAAHVAERFRSSYLIHTDGTHPHVHGANLGVRADAYLRAGGWRSLATAEDHDLWNRLRGAGCVCASSNRVKVVTSGRRIGRAPQGFASALAAHNGETTEVAA